MSEMVNWICLFCLDRILLFFFVFFVNWVFIMSSTSLSLYIYTAVVNAGHISLSCSRPRQQQTNLNSIFYSYRFHTLHGRVILFRVWKMAADDGSASSFNLVLDFLVILIYNGWWYVYQCLNMLLCIIWCNFLKKKINKKTNRILKIY